MTGAVDAGHDFITYHFGLAPPEGICEYHVDLRAMTQTNQKTGVTRKIRRWVLRDPFAMEH